jgi:hypothetical protein
MNDEKFYRETRRQIQHEDRLINYRVRWLLVLQAFLFGAYGFSLSAQAISEKEHLSDLTDLIMRTRDGLALAGILASFLLLFGIIAAAISMASLVAAWEKRPEQVRAEFPQIIGRVRIGRLGRGTFHLGLLPTYLLPVVSCTAWLLLHPDKLQIVAYTAAALTGLAITLAFGVLIGREWRKPDPPVPTVQVSQEPLQQKVVPDISVSPPRTRRSPRAE